jgi:hypothetical protein
MVEKITLRNQLIVVAGVEPGFEFKPLFLKNVFHRSAVVESITDDALLQCQISQLKSTETITVDPIDAITNLIDAKIMITLTLYNITFSHWRKNVAEFIGNALGLPATRILFARRDIWDDNTKPRISINKIIECSDFTNISILDRARLIRAFRHEFSELI